MRNISLPWWKRILAGDETAIPANWLDESGKLSLVGEEAVEFIKAIDGANVYLTNELAEACQSYVDRAVIEKTGKHPNTTKEWDDLYENS